MMWQKDGMRYELEEKIYLRNLLWRGGEKYGRRA